MTRLTLVRKWQSSTPTASVLRVATLAFQGPRIKVSGATCMGRGEFDVVLTASDRVHRGIVWSPRGGHVLPLLRDVLGFEGIRIRASNRDADTIGCTWVVADRVVDGDVKGRKSPAVERLGSSRSRLALQSVLGLLEEPARILIVNSLEIAPIEAA